MVRKTCADCGSLCLDQETRCWSCGANRFTLPGTQAAPSVAVPVGERTMYLGEADDRTQSWSQPGSWATNSQGSLDANRVALAVGGAVCAALAVGSVGFWVGRSSSSAPAPQPRKVYVADPMTLPTPPTSLSSASVGVESMVPAVDPFAGQTPAPRVTVRTKPGTPAMPPSNFTPTSAATAPVFLKDPPPTIIRNAMAAPVGHLTYGRPSLPSVMTPQVPAPVTGGPVLVPTSSRGVLVLRNEDSQAVEVTLDGNGSRTATLAAGASVPLPLDPGSYALKAGARGASGTSSALAVSAGQSYTLVFTRRKEGDREVLMILEPALNENPE